MDKPPDRPQPAYSSETQDEALHREVNSVKELIYVRLDEMDKAIELLQANVDKSPNTTELYGSISQLRDVAEQKFLGVKQKFEDLIERIEQTSVKDAKAVDAAFSAQKEAVGEQNKSNAQAIAKQEAAFTKQIDNLMLLVSTSVKGLDDKITDLKNSVIAIQGRAKGIGDSLGWLAALGMAVVAIAALGLQAWK